MIEILGYITAYLLVGIILLPFSAAIEFTYPEFPKYKLDYTGKALLITLWPFFLIITFIETWRNGYKYLTDNNLPINDNEN